MTSSKNNNKRIIQKTMTWAELLIKLISLPLYQKELQNTAPPKYQKKPSKVRVKVLQKRCFKILTFLLKKQMWRSSFLVHLQSNCENLKIHVKTLFLALLKEFYQDFWFNLLFISKISRIGFISIAFYLNLNSCSILKNYTTHFI